MRNQKHVLTIGLLLLSLLIASCAGAETDPDTDPDPSEEAETTTTEAEATDGREDWPEVIRVAAVPAEAAEDLGVSWGPFFDALSDELGGVSFDVTAASDYGAVIEAMIADRLDLAFFGSFAYHLAQQNGANIRALGASIAREDGQPGYHSLGVAQPDNDEVNDLVDFEGRTTCFVDPGSTSGYLFPISGLLGEGIDPEADLSPIFAGGHDTSLMSVVEGDCEVGFVHEFTILAIQDGRFTDATMDDFKIVWESPLIPGGPLAANLNTLPDSLISELQDAIIKYNSFQLEEEGYCEDYPEMQDTTEDGTAVCRIRGTYGYAFADDETYQPIRDICERTGADACRLED